MNYISRPSRHLLPLAEFSVFFFLVFKHCVLSFVLSNITKLSIFSQIAQTSFAFRSIIRNFGFANSRQAGFTGCRSGNSGGSTTWWNASLTLCFEPFWNYHSQYLIVVKNIAQFKWRTGWSQTPRFSSVVKDDDQSVRFGVFVGQKGNG